MSIPRGAHLTGLLLLGLSLAGCDTDKGPRTVPQDPARPAQPAAVEHDFGVIPHGEARTHDYVLDLDTLTGGPFVPLRAQLDCACGRATLVLRDSDGKERTLDGRPTSDNARKPGETLIVRVVINTLTKDPVDLPHAVSRGYVVLQPTDDRTGLRRVNWPLLLRFGIDCPVMVTPFASLDFALVPQSSTPKFVLTLKGDAAHPGVRFGPVASSDPAIEVKLDQEGPDTRLVARCHPDKLGSYRGVIGVGTDLESGYRVHLSVTWKVVPDLRAAPTDKLSFRARLDQPQTEAQSSSQYLLVSNHDVSKSPEFTVHELVGGDGLDAASSFEVKFEVAPGRPRQRRMFVRYLGGLDQAFRGKLVLTVDGEAGPFLPITLVVFPI